MEAGLGDKIDAESFTDNFSDARGYHFRARQFAQDGQRPSLIFNIGSVALERYLIALCALYGKMPVIHTYTCLVQTAESDVAFPPALKEDLLSLDNIFGLCSIDDYFHGVPGAEDSRRVLAMCEGVYELFAKPETAFRLRRAMPGDQAAAFAGADALRGQTGL